MLAKIDKKKSIGEVAKELDVQTHVIRFWESKFPQIKPEIGKGGRRYYFAKDVEILKKIQTFLYKEGYTIAGLQNLLKKRKKSDYEQDLQFLSGQENSDKNDSKNASKNISQTNLGNILDDQSGIGIVAPNNFENIANKNSQSFANKQSPAAISPQIIDAVTQSISHIEAALDKFEKLLNR